MRAVVLADGPTARVRFAGLSLAERARRVAAHAGAQEVLVADGTRDLDAWWSDGGAALLVISARAQMVHSDLVAPLLDTDGDRLVAVGPDGSYAGALLGRGAAADELIASLPDDAALAARWLEAGGTPIEHGPVGRHAAATPRERRRAFKHLSSIIHKPQDSPVTRYLYRTVSLPMTRALLLTPARPIHLSAVVALFGVVGAYFVAHAAPSSVVFGTLLVLIGGYFDGCDGELARFRFETSRLGAWIDTITDEATQVLYLGALGWHLYLQAHNEWIPVVIAASVLSYLVSMAIIYYFLIVVADSGNSQDYVGAAQVVVGDDGRSRLRPMPPAASAPLPGPLHAARAVALHLVRRDAINLGAMVFVLLGWMAPLYALLVAGGALAAIVTVPNHVRLRRQLRSLPGRPRSNR